MKYVLVCIDSPKHKARYAVGFVAYESNHYLILTSEYAYDLLSKTNTSNGNETVIPRKDILEIYNLGELR